MLQYQIKHSLFFAVLCIGISIASCTTEPETPVYTLTSNLEPTSESGSVLKSAEQREEGQTILIRAIPSKHWTFISWTGDHNGTEREIEVLMDSDKIITAIFEKRDYPLTIEIEGEGSVTEEIISGKSTEYQHGTAIKLRAEPENGWEFVEWRGSASGQDDTIEVTIDGETTITAVFKRIDFDLKVDIEGEGEVNQEIVTQKTSSYPFKTQVRLSAVPSNGWEFVSWTGDHESTNPNITVDVDRNKQITATFKRVDYKVRITIEGEGKVDQEIVQAKVIDTNYPFETSIQLTATPFDNWLWSNWAGDASGTDNVIEVNVDKAKNITAKFVAIPSVTTNSISQISQTGAVSGGQISNSSGVTIANKGLCWSTHPDTNPETNPDGIQCEKLGAGSSNYTVQMTNLQNSTTYYVRAVIEYSHHSTVTRVLGQERQFTTSDPIQLPSVTTNPVSAIKTYSAVSGGNVTGDGGADVTRRGICWSTAQNPSDENGTCSESGSGTGSFAITMGDLNPITSYYVRAYAINSAGTNFGNQVNFQTDQEISIPTVETGSASSITTSSAVVPGNVTSDGGATVTDRGVCVSTSQNPTTSNSCYNSGSGTGSFSSSISSLSSSTTYYARSYAINSTGTAYGGQTNFTTETPTTTPPPSSPPPTSSSVQVALVFLDGTHFDVTINGTLIPASKGFDYTFGSAGVKVISTSGNLKSMALDPNQIKVSGLNNEGFGHFSYKVVNKNSSANLYAINGNHNGNAEFWGQPASSNPLGIINNRSGDTVYNTKYPDALFYLGWRFDPINQPNNRNFEDQWSKTGKVAISFFNYGKNHGSPAVP